MTVTNKAFAYVFNTTSEGIKLSKVLSDWKSTETPCIPSLSRFDFATRTRIRKLNCMLFASSIGFEDRSLNIDKQAADTLTAVLIQYVPETSDRYLMSPFASRMRACLFAENVTMSELLLWSIELKRETGKPAENEKEPFMREIQLINHQNAVISQLSDTNKELSNRIAQLENLFLGTRPDVPQLTTPTTADESGDAAVAAGSTPGTCSSKVKGRLASKPTQALWFEWCTKTPRLWVVCDDRKYKLLTKQIVAFMKLFLPHGFQLILSCAPERKLTRICSYS